MEEKNPQALTMAYKRVVGKSMKIRELDITPDMNETEIDHMVKFMAEAKADREGGDWKQYLKGQRWYVEDLVKFSGMSAQERLDHEYALSFPEIAGESEMVTALNALI
jgi:hypothetical protein